MGKGYVVETKGTHKKHSKHSLPKARAEAQMRALYRAMGLEKKHHK
mgnify:CR=1 FL=1